MNTDESTTLPDVLVLVASPTIAIAGIIAAVLVHRLRLQHDRKLADLAVVRQLLARGIELAHRLQIDVVSFTRLVESLGSVPPRAGLTEEQREPAAQMSATWTAYLAEIEALMGTEAPVYVAVKEIRDHIEALLFYSSRGSPYREQHFGPRAQTLSTETLPDFRRKVGAVTRAHLPAPKRRRILRRRSGKSAS